MRTCSTISYRPINRWAVLQLWKACRYSTRKQWVTIKYQTPNRTPTEVDHESTGSTANCPPNPDRLRPRPSRHSIHAATNRFVTLSQMHRSIKVLLVLTLLSCAGESQD